MSMRVREPAMAQAAPESQNIAVYATAALSAAAALIHLWAVPGHLVEWWGYGAFFIAVALSQVLFGVALLRWRSPAIFLAGIAGNLSVVLLYVMSRVAGMPLGPHAGKLERAGALDMAATVSEVAVVVLLVGLLEGAYRKVAVNALLLLGLALWLLRFAGIVS